MKTIWLLMLTCCFSALATPPEPQVTEFTISKGSIVLDSTGVTFRADNQVQHFPFSKTSITDPAIPGLQVTGYQAVEAVSGTGGPNKDESILSLRGEDERSIDLTLGQPMDIYRVDITFSDQRHLTLWKMAWDTGPTAQSQYVSVTGGVRAPGRIVWKRDLTLLSAIVAAGGPSDTFHTPRAFIIRAGERIPYHLNSVMRNKIPDPPLQPGDQVEVSQPYGNLPPWLPKANVP